ncbi:hypothetical protein F7725_017975 [Dissostichus mawsoni]|uniref:Uncharacterized protein n=1 Tax=Dissostichus mawsoni TaxID=36200 RepID=A0A7J5XT29_DISMA|nr:hypothetical protein F7725_017975 [Dissostichus mawsoni]
MGSSESKMVVCAPIKPEPAIKNSRVSDLMDPRSPTALDRTPIQSEGKVLEAPTKCFNDAVEEEESFKGEEELASTVPLLSHQPSHTYDSLAEHANLLVTPLQSEGDLSPFVLLQNPQEVELETETDLSLEEAEEARETPLHKRLSMSLITYHEGETSAQIFADVHCDGASSPRMSVDVETLEDNVDHTYDLPTITVEPETPVEPPSPLIQRLPQHRRQKPKLRRQRRQTSKLRRQRRQTSTLRRQRNRNQSSGDRGDETKAPVEESSSSSPPPAPEPPSVSRSGIRCPSFDAKSPSQVVLKPQWLGKGFGATGIRARRVHSGKGGSSPLAVRVAVKNANRENKRLSGKLKQKALEKRRSELESDRGYLFCLYIVEVYHAEEKEPQFQIFRKLSQDPVQQAIPSEETPMQLTLLS